MNAKSLLVSLIAGASLASFADLSRDMRYLLRTADLYQEKA